MAAAPEQLGLVLGVKAHTPHSDDRVITTFLVRVEKEREAPPERLWVQLSIDDRTEEFSGARTGDRAVGAVADASQRKDINDHLYKL